MSFSLLYNYDSPLLLVPALWALFALLFHNQEFGVSSMASPENVDTKHDLSSMLFAKDRDYLFRNNGDQVFSEILFICLWVDWSGFRCWFLFVFLILSYLDKCVLMVLFLV